MLTPIVRTALGARRGTPLAAVAQTAAEADRPDAAPSTILRRTPAARRCGPRGRGRRMPVWPARGATTRSTRMTSLRMPTTRRGATPMPHSARNSGQPACRASCTMPRTA
ncbi:hypothetical protein DIE22_26785 [Burkholderia sp. Bp9142]|nr:hypothetical protein DIE22_26785 [Burkholderia sp. Bp9142]RQR47618.1 hypothetical protein DIE21_26020 [Burkholderia sp. Bp9140]